MGENSSKQNQEEHGLPHGEGPTQYQNIKPGQDRAKSKQVDSRVNQTNALPTSESQVIEGSQRPRRNSVLLKSEGPFPNSLVLNSSQINYKPTEIHNPSDHPLPGFENEQLKGKFINLVDLRCTSTPKNLIKDSYFFDEKDSVQGKEKKNPEMASGKRESSEGNAPTDHKSNARTVTILSPHKETAPQRREPQATLAKEPQQPAVPRTSHKKTQKLAIGPHQSRLKIGETQVTELRKTGSVPSFHYLTSKEIDLKECTDRQIHYAQPAAGRELIKDSNYIDESLASKLNLQTTGCADMLDFSVGAVEVYTSPQIKTYVYTQSLTSQIRS